jgi:hypothetical protein
MTNKTRNYFLMPILALLVLSFTACAKKISFQNSPVVPAARGTVKISRDNNKNYVIKIELLNLAESNRLQPPKTTYVVWMESDATNIKNLGQVKSDVKFLAKKLKASFETVSAVRPTKIFITAEDDPTVQYPGQQMVLSTGGI